MRQKVLGQQPVSSKLFQDPAESTAVAAEAVLAQSSEVPLPERKTLAKNRGGSVSTTRLQSQSTLGGGDKPTKRPSRVESAAARSTH